MRTLDGAGLVPAGVVVREPSLDDVFLALTGHRAEPHNGQADHGGADETGDAPTTTTTTGDVPRQESQEAR
jgi:oleandomycin transport system ATP-binding protein